jgi:hypothetical protein
MVNVGLILNWAYPERWPSSHSISINLTEIGSSSFTDCFCNYFTCYELHLMSITYDDLNEEPVVLNAMKTIELLIPLQLE